MFMRIRVDDIKDEGLDLETDETPAAFPTVTEAAEAEGCTFVAPLQTRLRVIRVGEMVEVEGTVESRIRLSCSRCLAEHDEPLVAGFALTYARQMPEVTDEAGEEEVELSAEEMGLTLFHGDEIDLGEAIAEQVIMALPMRPLCREECRGLCPLCGTNLNEGDCGCERPVFNAKFAALKKFKPEK
jgi:uncharacterized protein